MELLKFLKELKNNKYLTLNQLEYDINKLKFMLDKPIKFNYVKCIYLVLFKIIQIIIHHIIMHIM